MKVFNIHNKSKNLAAVQVLPEVLQENCQDYDVKICQLGYCQNIKNIGSAKLGNILAKENRNPSFINISDETPGLLVRVRLGVMRFYSPLEIRLVLSKERTRQAKKTDHNISCYSQNTLVKICRNCIALKYVPFFCRCVRIDFAIKL